MPVCRDPSPEAPELPRLSDLQNLVQDLLDRGGSDGSLRIQYTARATEFKLGPVTHRSSKLSVTISPERMLWRKLKAAWLQVLRLGSRLLPAAGRLLVRKGS